MLERATALGCQIAGDLGREHVLAAIGDPKTREGIARDLSALTDYRSGSWPAYEQEVSTRSTPVLVERACKRLRYLEDRAVVAGYDVDDGIAVFDAQHAYELLDVPALEELLAVWGGPGHPGVWAARDAMGSAYVTSFRQTTRSLRGVGGDN